MNATSLRSVVGVDLSESVFELAVADDQWRVVERARLTRSQFERWFVNRAVGLVVMEACGSAHHLGRWLAGLGIEVKLLAARYVRAYVKRNKTDAPDQRTAAWPLSELGSRVRLVWWPASDRTTLMRTPQGRLQNCRPLLTSTTTGAQQRE